MASVTHEPSPSEKSLQSTSIGARRNQSATGVAGLSSFSVLLAPLTLRLWAPQAGPLQTLISAHHLHLTSSLPSHAALQPSSHHCASYPGDMELQTPYSTEVRLTPDKQSCSGCVRSQVKTVEMVSRLRAFFSGVLLVIFLRFSCGSAWLCAVPSLADKGSFELAGLSSIAGFSRHSWRCVAPRSTLQHGRMWWSLSVLLQLKWHWARNQRTRFLQLCTRPMNTPSKSEIASPQRAPGISSTTWCGGR